MVAKLSDVARLAGVSVTTVSRVINNYSSLSEKTIQKVHAAMRELNYQPNALARAMQGKGSKFVGLILPNLTNPFYAELSNEIEYQLFQRGYKTIIASSAENEAIEHEYLAMLSANQVDGIISSSHNLAIKEYQQLSAPIVSFDRRLAETIPTVTSDNYQGGQLAAQYLADHGCQKIAVLIDEDRSYSPTVNRLQGAVDYLTQVHLQADPLDVNDLDLRTVFPGEYDGVVAPNDLLAMQIIGVFKTANRRLGGDFWVVGYDGSQLIQKLAPQLPTIVQPSHQLAMRLIEILMHQIQGLPVEPELMNPLPVYLHSGE